MPAQVGTTAEAHVIGYMNGWGTGGAFRVGHVPAWLANLSMQGEVSGQRLQAAGTPNYPLANTGAEELSFRAAIAYQTDAGATYKLSYQQFRNEQRLCFCLRLESPVDFLRHRNNKRRSTRITIEGHIRSTVRSKELFMTRLWLAGCGT